MTTTTSIEFFHQVYTGKPAWEIDVPQPAIIKLAEAGKIVGSVLDIGCGTGCNAIYLAERGHSVTAFDLVPQAIEQAKARVQDSALPVTFQVANVLKLPMLGQFDSAIDAGVFHVFSDKDRPRYVENIAKQLKRGARLWLICFSEHQPGTEGPRRVTQAELRSSFRADWKVHQIDATEYLTQASAYGPAKAWLAEIERL
jgi:cyclopropane fatty-acyl-phospholipid synthase-like methyltransferase